MANRQFRLPSVGISLLFAVAGLATRNCMIDGTAPGELLETQFMLPQYSISIPLPYPFISTRYSVRDKHTIPAAAYLSRFENSSIEFVREMHLLRSQCSWLSVRTNELATMSCGRFR